MNGNAVELERGVGQEFMATFKSVNGLVATMAAEVINLSRNVIISGDPFTKIDCDASPVEDFPGESVSSQGCMCSSIRTKCTIGMHAIASTNAVMKVKNTRIGEVEQGAKQRAYSNDAGDENRTSLASVQDAPPQ